MPLPHYQISERGILDRRSFVVATSSLAAAALWSKRAVGAVTQRPKFSSYPFTLGVASGDPSWDGMVLWTRLAPSPLDGGGMNDDLIDVSWMVAEDEAMTKVVKKGKMTARPDWAHSVHVEVEGLWPDRWYWYQFKAGSEVSQVGRTRTMPLPGAMPDRVRFMSALREWLLYGVRTLGSRRLGSDRSLGRLYLRGSRQGKPHTEAYGSGNRISLGLPQPLRSL